MRKTLILLVVTFLVAPLFSAFPMAHAESSAELISKGDPTLPVVLGIRGLPTVENPFDRDLADISATITQPDKTKIVAKGFWYQEYKITNINNQRSAVKVGEPYWRIAFASTKAGKYSLVFSAVIKGQSIPVSALEVTTDYVTLEKVTTKGNTFVRGNSPFVPIAYNIAWANRFEEIEKYNQWFSQASKAGVNVARVWMASWSLGIEWTDTGLGDYSKRLDRAWILDQIFIIAAKYNIGINLVLINHGAFSSSVNPEWYSNPYNVTNGGPISNAAEFATNSVAWRFWERRLNYLVARYASYPSLFTWEWWNEVNFTPISEKDLISWIAKSSAILDATDPYRTLRTSSWSSAASIQNWDNLDYIVTHVYDASDPIKSLGVQAEVLRAAFPNKPILVGEMGSGTVTEDPFTDPTGLHLHNSQWAAVFVGFAGPASYWWWDIYIDPLELWGHTKGLSKLVAGLNLPSMKPSRTQGLPMTSTLTLSSANTILGWIRHNNFDRSAKTQQLLDAAIIALKTKKQIQKKFPDPVSKGGRITIPVELDGKYKVTFINTFTGTQLTSQNVQSTEKKVSITAPKFIGDIAFRIERVIV